MENKLKLTNIHKVYGEDNSVEAIKNISFDINVGEVISIVGTSGCGKSTLLNIIAGLDDATSGEICFDTSSPKISYMLQNDALLPWRTVLENATLGLEISKNLNKDSVKYTKALLNDYGLNDFLDKKIDTLSGGMRQRVALVRSLATQPDILLLDEPFSALDYCTRIAIANDVRKIIKKMKMTTILITHDIAEALSISDRVIVLSKRPSIVKNVYDVPFSNVESTLEKRSLKEFNDLYEKIWRDLDVQI